jgi:hypothetical protein
MEITFTREELSKMMTDLDNWYNLRSMYVMERIVKLPVNHNDPYGHKGTAEHFHKFAKAFQEENPKPDWRSML